jgi:hypothetical protein
LPETFIAESVGSLGYRFRLAGTKTCEQFGRELRGADLLALWHGADRDAVASLLRSVHVRHHEQGIALQFVELQDPDSLARAFG